MLTRGHSSTAAECDRAVDAPAEQAAKQSRLKGSLARSDLTDVSAFVRQSPTSSVPPPDCDSGYPIGHRVRSIAEGVSVSARSQFSAEDPVEGELAQAVCGGLWRGF
jgi:hypothetical protein